VARWFGVTHALKEAKRQNPVALVGAEHMNDYEGPIGFPKGIQAGERIRGSSLMVTILPVLHTGQRHGFMPVSLAKRSTLVSDGFCRLITVSISGFFVSIR